MRAVPDEPNRGAARPFSVEERRKLAELSHRASAHGGHALLARALQRSRCAFGRNERSRIRFPASLIEGGSQGPAQLRASPMNRFQ